MADGVLESVKEEFCGVGTLLIAWLAEMLSRIEEKHGVGRYNRQDIYKKGND